MQTQQRNDDLIAAYIEPNPNRSGADEVRLKDSGVSVWAIVGYWQGYRGDVAAVADGFDVPVEAVEAALAYYEQHRAVMNNRLIANDPDAEAEFVREIEQNPDARIRRWLVPDDRRPGADEVRLKGSGVSVWAIVGYWKGYRGDVAAVADGFAVPVEAVEAALAYYHTHKEVIDSRRAANYSEDVD